MLKYKHGCKITGFKKTAIKSLDKLGISLQSAQRLITDISIYWSIHEYGGGMWEG